MRYYYAETPSGKSKLHEAGHSTLGANFTRCGKVLGKAVDFPREPADGLICHQCPLQAGPSSKATEREFFEDTSDITAWDRFAAAALNAQIVEGFPKENIITHAAKLADLMMAERAKRFSA